MSSPRALTPGTVEVQYFWRFVKEEKLERISQISQPNNSAAKTEHPKEILCVTFIAYDQPAEVLQSGKQPLDLYDSDALGGELRKHGIELIAPH